jgi:MFS family permease
MSGHFLLQGRHAKTFALLLLAMTQFVVVMDASGTHLHFARADLSWVVNAYTLTFGGFLLLGGRLGDLLGRRRMFMLGLVVFSLASFAGGMAQSEGWLLGARAIQGVGAAIVSPRRCRSSPRLSLKAQTRTGIRGPGAPSPVPEVPRESFSAGS